MEKIANATKAFITHWIDNKEKVLILKNALDDPNRPGAPDLPGGRLEIGENPYTGLKREIAEELGQNFSDAVIIGRPVDIAHFDRPDGQTVTMMFFNCWLKQKELPEIKLSAEHSTYEWITLNKVENYLSGANWTHVLQHAFRNLVTTYWND